ncbi:MAG: hypothetical protein AAF579_11680 [Cyanobacteria bacterium P01_C01_bin.118]
MSGATLDSTQLKEVIKAALVEILQEQRGLLYDLITEVMEDIALAKAIDEGKDSEQVDRNEIFSMLETAE